MDAWLKNWIDEWDAQYEQLQADRKESPKGESKPSICLLYTSPSPRDGLLSRMPSSA